MLRNSEEGRVKRFLEAIKIYEKIPTSRQREKIETALEHICATNGCKNLMQEVEDKESFWVYMLNNPNALERFLAGCGPETWCQFLLRLDGDSKFYLGRGDYPTLRPLLTIAGKCALLLPSADEFIKVFLAFQGPDFDFIADRIRRLPDDELTWLITSLVKTVDHLWAKLTGWWWESEQLAQLIKLLWSIYSERSNIPVDTYYSFRQEQMMWIQESIVLLRGNQEPRNMAKYIHMLYDLESKSRLIELENSIQMRHELQDAFFRTLFEGLQSTTLNLMIRRDHIVQDALSQIETKKAYELRRQLKVKFVGEDGVDEGGLQKEFFQLLLKSCFNPEYGIFKYYEESRLHWFCPTSDDRMTHEAAEDCYAIGKLFGVAMYNSVLLDVHFPAAFYKMLLDKPIGIDDLIELDPELGRGLKAILKMEREEFEASGLDETPFEIEITSGSGKALKFSLPTRQSMLSYDNRYEYVQLYAEAVLHRTVELALQAFIRGFKFVFGKSILFQFHPSEIEALLCGSQEFDYANFQATTTYEGGFSTRSAVIKWFWDIFHKDMTEFQRRSFLTFITGNDRAPVGGLGRLQMKIMKNGPDADRLPSAHTCFNTLLLNAYSSRERLKHWLMMAIDNCTGFGLQ